MRPHARNAAWNTAGFLLPTFALVITTPVFTSKLGLDGFGVYALITTLLGMNGIAALGLADATTKFVAEKRTKAKDDMVRLVQTGSALYLVASVTSGVVLYLLAPVLVERLFAVDAVWRQQAVTCLQIGAVAFSLRLMESFAGSVTLGFSRYDLVNQVDIVCGLTLIGVQTLLLLAGYGLVSLIVAIVALATASTAIKLLLTARLLDGFAAFCPRFHRTSAESLLCFSAFTWLQGLNQILGSQVDRLFIAGFLGTQALSYYVVCTRIASLVQILPARATSFIFPLAAEQRSSGNLARLRLTYFTAQNLTIVLSLVLAAPLFLYAPAILKLWLGDGFAENSILLLRFLIMTYTFLASSILPFYYLNGVGMPGLNAAFGFAGTGIYVLALFVFLPWMQVVGAAMAKLSSHSLSLFCYPILHRRVFDDRRWYVGLLVIFPPVIVYIIFILCLQFLHQPSSVPILFLCSIASTIVTAIMAFPLVFYTNPVVGISFTASVKQVACAILINPFRR